MTFGTFPFWGKGESAYFYQGSLYLIKEMAGIWYCCTGS